MELEITKLKVKKQVNRLSCANYFTSHPYLYHVDHSPLKAFGDI